MIHIHTDSDSHELGSLESAISFLLKENLFTKSMLIVDEKNIFYSEEKYIDNTNKDYYFISVEYASLNHRDELSKIVDAIHEFNKSQAEKIVGLMTNQ